MLQQKTPEDFVVATGQTHSVRDFVKAAFAHVGIEDWQKYVEVDPQFFRPAEVDRLIGDASKARLQLGWQPRVSFEELVNLMVESGLRQIARLVSVGK